MERRAELRAKIEKRRERLKNALADAIALGAPEQRTNGLAGELQVVDNLLSGGWEKMAQATAADLMRWMDRTGDLIGNRD